MIIGKKVNKITSSSLAEESSKIIDAFQSTVNKLRDVAKRADDEKAAKEQEIILLQTETANLSEVSNKQLPWPIRLEVYFNNQMGKLIDIKDIEFELDEFLNAESFLDLAKGDITRAFALGYLRDELQEPLHAAIDAGDKGLRLSKSFDMAIQKVRPYVNDMTKISDEEMSKDDFSLMEVCNAVLDQLTYEEPEDELYVAFVLGMWTLHLLHKATEAETDSDEDFVEDPTADA
jgi:hypothetical protein